jgi:hypothetical protein
MFARHAVGLTYLRWAPRCLAHENEIFTDSRQHSRLLISRCPGVSATHRLCIDSGVQLAWAAREVLWMEPQPWAQRSCVRHSAMQRDWLSVSLRE